MTQETEGVLMKALPIRRALLVGVVAALASVPVASAANRTVQIDGKLVAPTQVSQAQLAAGHAASTRLVQVGGHLLKPSQVSPWQSSGGLWSDTSNSSASSSSGLGSGGVALIAVAGALVLLASSAALMRRRVPLSRAT
jgi:hypothetical protein